MAEKGKLYVMSINFDKIKHKDLVGWIKANAEQDDRSISSFCINALKEYRKQRERQNGDK